MDFVTTLQEYPTDHQIWKAFNYFERNFSESFRKWSGSSKKEQHHYGDGGLKRHTDEVTVLMLQTKQTLNLDIPDDVIILTARFHDIGKIWDYERINCNPLGEQWVSTEHKRKIHHISRSALEWSRMVEKTGLYKDWEDEVLHAILAHHGLREWGSPVAPATKLAWLLHLCDGLSARMDDCDKTTEPRTLHSK